MHVETRQLKDLVSIGPAMLEDFELLGIHSVAQLKRRNPQRMYRDLCRIRNQVIDPCCLDTFVAAVAQAKDPNLPIEQRQSWYGAECESLVRESESQPPPVSARVSLAAVHVPSRIDPLTISQDEDFRDAA